MTESLAILMATGASLGFVHTITGPDHYLPFIMIGRARRWSLSRTALLTALCGIGHVGSSVLIGLVGIALGVMVGRLETIEAVRGNIAAYLLIVFGLGYGVWGLWRARRGGHVHGHVHADGTRHEHDHEHVKAHEHRHEDRANITPWVLFIIFVLGPCEPLIPVLMYPAAKGSIFGVVAVTGVFSLLTVGTMLGMVVAFHFGLHRLPLSRLERYTHAIAGFMIFLSGMAIQFLGL